jgi:hypothetical protein
MQVKFGTRTVSMFLAIMMFAILSFRSYPSRDSYIVYTLATDAKRVTAQFLAVERRIRRFAGDLKASEQCTVSHNVAVAAQVSLLA